MGRSPKDHGFFEAQRTMPGGSPAQGSLVVFTRHVGEADNWLGETCQGFPSSRKQLAQVTGISLVTFVFLAHLHFKNHFHRSRLLIQLEQGKEQVCFDKVFKFVRQDSLRWIPAR